MTSAPGIPDDSGGSVRCFCQVSSRSQKDSGLVSSRNVAKQQIRQCCERHYVQPRHVHTSAVTTCCDLFHVHGLRMICVIHTSTYFEEVPVLYLISSIYRYVHMYIIVYLCIYRCETNVHNVHIYIYIYTHVCVYAYI